MASNEKQSLERRSVHVAELARKAALRLSRLDEREERIAAETADLEKRATELAHLEEHVERRMRELEAYVARVQGSLPSLP
jgi:hypothetical protein